MGRNVAVQILRGVLAGEFYYATDTAQLFLGTSGSPLLVNAAASGSVNKGTATLNFGVFPGVSDTSVVVINQSGIVAGSVVQAWLLPVATADHSADEHNAETLKIIAGNIVPGTGFTIYGLNNSQLDDPVGHGTRIYGAWNVAWIWV